MFSMDALSVAARVGIGDLADPRLPQSHSQTNIMWMVGFDSKLAGTIYWVILSLN